MHSDIDQRIRKAIRDVADFPTAGITFKDITPLLADAALTRAAINAMAEPYMTLGVTHVVGIESRGFLFGMPIAMQLGAAFAPARKPGKLPWRSIRESYALEYRASDVLELHEDALTIGARVLIVDDVLATGGTASAAIRLCERLGGEVLAVSVLIELAFLGGRNRTGGVPVAAIVRY